MEKTLTIFTPTYNRAYRIDLCYNSLIRQTCKDFLWLIIDDGSTDNTHTLVQEWMARDNGFEIKYIYKENGGVHTAYNTAYKVITTELNMCIDSDDYIKDDAVELIIDLWRRNKSEEYAGIIALDINTEGIVIGNKLPDRKDTHLMDYYHKGGKGDKKMIYRTDVMLKLPQFPVFESERYFWIGYKFFLADQDYKLLILNKPVCVVEYNEAGYSKNMFKIYVKNPKGFAYTKYIQIKFEKRILYRYKLCIQYIAFNLLANNKHFLKHSPDKLLTFCAVPFGIALYFFIKLIARR